MELVTQGGVGLVVIILGDRIMFQEYVALLKKHKRDAGCSKALHVDW